MELIEEIFLEKLKRFVEYSKDKFSHYIARYIINYFQNNYELLRNVDWCNMEKQLNSKSGSIVILFNISDLFLNKIKEITKINPIQIEVYDAKKYRSIYKLYLEENNLKNIEDIKIIIIKNGKLNF